MKETDYERFIRFSKAIAANLPTEDGEEMGYVLLKEHWDDPVNLSIALLTFLIAVGYDEEEALIVFKAAITRSFRLIFSAEPEKEIEA